MKLTQFKYKIILLNPLFFLYLFFFILNEASANTILATRLWPAQEYTRITLESQEAINYHQFTLSKPDRIVIDMTNVALNETLKNLPNLVPQQDSYIANIRVANFKSNVVRLVIELKNKIKLKLFTLPATAPYQQRFVIDLYPLQDPLDNIVTNIKPSLLLSKSPASTTENSPSNASEDNKTISNTPANGDPPPKNSDTEEATAINKTETQNEKKIFTVVIDAGHGGEDPGAIGRNSKEKDITLAIARKLKMSIDNEENMRALLTRDDDFFIPLQRRVTKARRMKADIFISIHADAFNDLTASGSSVFALSEKGASSAFARYLARKENASDLIGGVSFNTKDINLTRTLLDLSQTATINESMLLAKSVLTEIEKVNPLHKKRVEQAGFAVLKAPDIPSILIETAFISNPEEEEKLMSEEYQTTLAQTILTGIKNYMERKF